MKIDFKQIKDLLQNGNLAEVARETGIAYRTLQDWKLENNKWLQQAEERLTKIQNYINMEENKMKELNEIKKYMITRKSVGGAQIVFASDKIEDAEKLKADLSESYFELVELTSEQLNEAKSFKAVVLKEVKRQFDENFKFEVEYLWTGHEEKARIFKDDKFIGAVVRYVVGTVNFQDAEGHPSEEKFVY